MKQSLRKLIAAIGFLAAFADTGQARPNVILIISDDLGYADLGCQGSRQVKTPHIDPLARNGVRFTHGYVTSPQCGPSRAGLLTGRYQARFGFESNAYARKPAIPVSEKLISDRMKTAGYTTGYIGKWGVGNQQASGPDFTPPQRGFDESYWNSDGNFYFGAKPNPPHDVQMYRGNEPAKQPHYSTEAFGHESVEFVKRHRDKPFFLCVSFIAPHEPMEAKEEYLARFPDVEDPLRRKMLAMMACMDDNIGRLLETLRELNIEENTLLFFISDNGGAPKHNGSVNHPFRGTKTTILEGGIRVPFLFQWKGKVPAGMVYEKPVISLDILPTALAAAGIDIRPEWKTDGVDLLPFLTEQARGRPHDVLYWRFHIDPKTPQENRWAIRQGDWMLLQDRVGHAPMELHDLANDPFQKMNVIHEHPERAAAMRKQWEAWNSAHPELPLQKHMR
jgi:arylsulfatase A-like enzyme